MRYYVRRIGRSLITLFSVITITFIIIKYMPGGPMSYLRSQLISSGQADMIGQLTELYMSFNPTEPLWVQYIDYMLAVLTGDLGTSIYTEQEVSYHLARTLPWTIFYGSISLVVTYVISVLLGGIMAYSEGSRFDMGGTGILILSNSVPYYLVGMILLSFLGFQYGLFPTRGKIGGDVAIGLNPEFMLSALHHSTLLIVSFVVTTTGGITLAARGNSISILGSDYLRVGRLRGVHSSRLATRYVARNALLPLYTQFMISMGFVFGGSTVLETVFRYPGAGKLIIDAMRRRDVPLMMGIFVILSIAVVVGVLIADLTYGILDPRTEEGESSGF